MNKPITVSQINNYIKEYLEENHLLYKIRVVGEVSNLSKKGRYVYFSLKDESSIIRCAIFSNLDVKNLKDGDKIIVNGKINLYVPYGTYSIIVNSFEEFGKGDLLLEYENLKKELEKNGFFNKNKKILDYPKKVGLISAADSAASHDVKEIIKKRNKSVSVYHFHAAVQGINCVKEVINGIKYFNNKFNVDTIIIARGGGSFEDLYSFSNKKMLLEIYNSEIPIISAIGHQTDFQLSDFVADHRAKTPSEAAEMVTKELSELEYKIYDLNQNIKYNFENRLKEYKNKINSSNLINNYNNYLLNLKLRLKDLDIISLKDEMIIKINNNLVRQKDNIVNDFFNLINSKNREIDDCYNIIYNINPKKILKKGYGIIKLNNTLINSVDEINVNDDLSIRIYDGEIISSIKEIKRTK